MSSTMKGLKITVGITVFSLFLLLTVYHLWPLGESDYELHTPALKFRHNDRLKILIWAQTLHEFDWTFPILSNGDGGCDITRNKEEIANADAVVFYIKYMGSLPHPSARRLDQVYTWWSHESPRTTMEYYRLSYKEKKYRNFFNWTMTYRMDDDVISAMWPTPTMDYLLLRLGRKSEMIDTELASKRRLSEEDFQRQLSDLLSRKRKSTAWIVSDCNLLRGAKRRNTIVESLENEGGLVVDKFGKCAGNPIPFNFTVLFQTLSPYKFYLAFENSPHCRDYLTEKTIFNSLVSGVVPVIDGPTKEDVAKILPERSYILVEDFENRKKLAEYMDYLDKNDTEYSKYFTWWKDPGAQTFPRYGFNYGQVYSPKDRPSVSPYPFYSNLDLQDDWLEYERFGLYHLCRKLKRGDHRTTTKIIEDISASWYRNENPECLN